MASPSEYQTFMYEVFWNGNIPTERETAEGKPGSTMMTPKKALDDLDALFAEAKKLRGETDSE
jgi:hypothetical protein